MQLTVPYKETVDVDMAVLSRQLGVSLDIKLTEREYSDGRKINCKNIITQFKVNIVCCVGK